MHDKQKSTTDSDKLLFTRYHHAIAQNTLTFDESQHAALQSLQTLLDILHAPLTRRKPWPWRTHAMRSIQGLYVFGGVGRGKSMLMSWFYDSCQLTQKRRVHFHVFMQDVHRFIHQHPSKNPLHTLAKTMRKTTQLLCLDEFYISDIAEGMLLSGLFSALFAEGITVVITSNYHPDALYPNGLQRPLILPFLRLLHEKTTLVELAGTQDYRLIKTPHTAPRYFYPLNAHTDNAIKNHLPTQSAYTTYTFAQLCAQPKGAKDYLELAQGFSYLVLTQIPQFTKGKNDEIRRFMTLIDVLYEYNVTLLCSAQVAINALYLDDDGQLDFERTRSRLIAMQAADYPPLPNKELS